MNLKFQSKTTNQTTRCHKISLDTLVIVRLMALAIIVFAAQGVAYAQGPPDRVVSEHALGNSPLADQLNGEEPITVTGILNIIIGDDFANKRSRTHYFIKDAKTKETFKLRFAKKAPKHLRSGATVKARGRARGRELYLALDESGEESVETMLPAQVVVAGEQKTLVMVANFTDTSVSCLVDEIQDLMFTDLADGSIDDFYQETSSGNIWFNGDVVGPYTIEHTSTDACNIGAWADAADAAAQADGMDPGAYTRKVYVLPSTNGCGSYAGIGQVGGSPTKAWIFYCGIEDVYAHELGHNLGMHHASTPNSEYGDTTDIMGAGNNGLRHLNSAHLNEMGWRSPVMNVLITESGTYDIAPQSMNEAQSLEPQILRIAKPDTNEYYYIAYRRPLGFDSNLQWWHHDMVTVHRYKGADGPPTNTYLLDELAVDDSFTDAVNNITVTHISHTPDYARVQIQFNSDGQSCITAPPSANISPTSQSAAPGSTLTYTVTVSTADNAYCTASTFSLNATLPDGWTGSVLPANMTLSPGDSGTATLSVTSPGAAAEASYGLTVNVTDAAEPAHAESAGATYTVEPVCNPGTPIAGILPANQSAVAGTTLDYTVTVSNTDSTPCPASTFFLSPALPGGWTGNVFPSTLTLSPGDNGAATLTVTSPTGAAETDYGLTINVSDGTEPVHSTAIGASYVVEGVNEADTEAPTVPGGLSGGLKGKNVKLTWNAATDNVGVNGYAVWRNGARIGDTTGTGYVDSAIPSSMTCAYTVSAYDAAGNISGPSNAVSVTARGGSKGGGKGKPKK